MKFMEKEVLESIKKQYLLLKTTRNDANDSSLVASAFMAKAHHIKKTNEIYGCLGTYQTVVDKRYIFRGAVKVPDDCETATYRLYCDLEKPLCKSFHLPMPSVADFEANNPVIFFSKNPELSFYLFQQEYLLNMVQNGQETACEMALVLAKSRKEE